MTEGTPELILGRKYEVEGEPNYWSSGLQRHPEIRAGDVVELLPMLEGSDLIRSNGMKNVRVRVVATGRYTVVCPVSLKLLPEDGTAPQTVAPVKTEDVVNHPSHYTAYPVEVITLTAHMNFCRGNAVKYIARAGLKDKDKEVEDLRKAQWYINREIERLGGTP